MKLNKCPFCGADDACTGVDRESGDCYVTCFCCGARGTPDKRIDFAREYWNARVEDEPEEEGFISGGSVPEDDKLCQIYVKSYCRAYAKWNKEKGEWDGVREGDIVLSWKAVE